jgi:hypothetical protein
LATLVAPCGGSLLLGRIRPANCRAAACADSPAVGRTDARGHVAGTRAGRPNRPLGAQCDRRPDLVTALSPQRRSGARVMVTSEEEKKREFVRGPEAPG